MAWSQFAMEAGGSALQHGLSFITAQREAKSRKRWQDFRNRMLRFANAEQQNTITLNERMTIQRSAMEAKAIKDSARLTGASTAVAAAAAGVSGRSVVQTMNQVRRNASMAEQRRELDLRQQLLGYQTQRESMNMQVVQQTEYDPIPKPTGAAQLMGFAQDLGGLWDTYGADIKASRTNKTSNARRVSGLI